MWVLIFNLQVCEWYEALNENQLRNVKQYNLHTKYKQNYKANKKQINKINLMWQMITL